jgi:hypothetical protein
MEDAFMTTSWATDHNLFFRQHLVANFEPVAAVITDQFHWHSHLEPIILLHSIVGKVKCVQKILDSSPLFRTRNIQPWECLFAMARDSLQVED